MPRIKGDAPVRKLRLLSKKGGAGRKYRATLASVVIPKTFIQELGWKDGDNIWFEREGDRIVMYRVLPEELNGRMLPYVAIAQEREREARKRAKRKAPQHKQTTTPPTPPIPSSTTSTVSLHYLPPT